MPYIEICTKCNLLLAVVENLCQYCYEEELEENKTSIVKEPESIDGMTDWRETQI